YRSIDTAQVYKNEADVGAFLQSQLEAGDLTRTDVFITTKIAPANQGSERAHDSILESLRKLNLEYIDLVLIHWPGSSGLKPHDTQNIAPNGEERVRVKAIGVSNYEAKHILELLEYAVRLMVFKVELHPLYGCKELWKVCDENGIQVQAYSSLGEGNLVRREYLENTISVMESDLLMSWMMCWDGILG
ncbi:NADP-dependent oxidoreductase domain-containing protein, partial [Chytridium lagenaria]